MRNKIHLQTHVCQYMHLVIRRIKQRVLKLRLFVLANIDTSQNINIVDMEMYHLRVNIMRNMTLFFQCTEIWYFL